MRRMNQKQTRKAMKEQTRALSFRIGIIFRVLRDSCSTMVLQCSAPPYNWGISLQRLFHRHAFPFSLTVVLILDISLEIQLYILQSFGLVSQKI